MYVCVFFLQSFRIFYSKRVQTFLFQMLYCLSIGNCHISTIVILPYIIFAGCIGTYTVQCLNLTDEDKSGDKVELKICEKIEYWLESS